jgi:hypothetical protein
MSYPYRYAPDAELIGAAASSLLYSLRRDDMMPLLKKHNLDDIQDGQWYPVNRFVNLFKEMIERSEGDIVSNLVSIGVIAIDRIIVPPGVGDLPYDQILMMVGQLYAMQHRNGDAGTYQIERVGEKHIKYACNSVYPDHLMYGYVYGVAKRFMPSGTQFRVAYDEEASRQDDGGDVTIVHLTWK